MRQVERNKAEAMRWPILEPIEADGQVNPIALSKPVCVAGDRGRVNLPLHSPQISRAHALFVTDADGVYLRDLASLNGVRVNDGPVREAVLHEGDVVGLGPFSFRCLKNFPSTDGADQPHSEAAELRLTQNGARVPLTSRTFVIGSREECDLHLSDDAVAAAHAVIFERDGRRFIRDLRSATGTHVNGDRVGEIEIHAGDSIQIGNTTIEFAVRSEAPPQPAAAEAEPEDSLIEPLVESPLDEVSLAADDSLVAAPRPPTADEAEAPQGAPVPAAADSAIIPLMDDSPEPTPAAAAPTPTPPAPVAPAPSIAAATSQPSSGDSALIPIEPEPQPVSKSDALDEPEEHPQATAAELLEGHEHDMLPTAKPDENSRTFEVHPGTIDRAKAEEAFSELLDDLAENVEQVQSVWEDLKTSTEDPRAGEHPGSAPDRPADKKDVEPSRSNSERRKSRRDLD